VFFTLISSIFSVIFLGNYLIRQNAAAEDRAPESLRYNDHQIGRGPEFHRLACEHGVEGIVSKRANDRYEPDRHTWLKIKCLNREEFVVVGWSDPEGGRHRIGALLLGYYTPEGRPIYAGRVGTGMPVDELERLWQRLRPWLSTRCRWPSRHREAPGSDHRWCSVGSIGCGPKWWSKSRLWNGRLMAYSDTWFTWASATTRWPWKYAAADLVPIRLIRGEAAAPIGGVTGEVVQDSTTPSGEGKSGVPHVLLFICRRGEGG
jgi:ATP dependent DNA ligase C terminal region